MWHKHNVTTIPLRIPPLNVSSASFSIHTYCLYFKLSRTHGESDRPTRTRDSSLRFHNLSFSPPKLSQDGGSSTHRNPFNDPVTTRNEKRLCPLLLGMTRSNNSSTFVLPSRTRDMCHSRIIYKDRTTVVRVNTRFLNPSK